jgi:hypothetical protein
MAARLFQFAVDIVVGLIRLVMEQVQFLDAGFVAEPRDFADGGRPQPIFLR